MRSDLFIITIIMVLALAPGAFCLGIGGGAGAVAGAGGQASGSFTADRAGASSSMITSGSVPHAGELRFVQDDSGKRAEILFSVTGLSGSVKYSASFSPREGSLGRDADAVSASQTLTIPAADSLFIHSAARSGPNIAVTNLTAARVGTSKASFTGTAQSQAAASNATARIQGRVVGAVNGTASYGGSIAGPYEASKTRDSLGGKVDCNLVMQASSALIAGFLSGTISGVSSFTADAAAKEKVQDAINAAWDGDAVNVAKGTYKENIVLAKNLTVKGAGSAKTIIDGSRSGSVFSIARTRAKVALSDMTIQNGNATYGGGVYSTGNVTISGCRIMDNSATLGGAAYSTGRLAVTGSTVSSNYAVSDGGGVYSTGALTIDKSTISSNYARSSGGIRCLGTITITDSTLSGNNAIGDGGAIYNSGTMTVSGSTFSGNTASRGAGVTASGTTTLTGCTFLGNSADSGAGVYSYGTTRMVNCQITKNMAVRDGGGVQVSDGLTNMTGCTISGNSGLYGGGVNLYRGRVNVTGCTISSNAAFMGGGIYNDGELDVMSSTISTNTARRYGGGISSSKNMTIAGSTQITGNKALAWYGGGVYVSSATGLTTFDGTKVLVKNNRGGMLAQGSEWYRGWGVYVEGSEPTMTGGFDPSAQLIGNTKL